MTSHLDRLTSAIADRYGVERELGAGGIATVYLADDLKHGRSVAIKVLQHFVFKQHLAAFSPREIRLIQQWHAALSARSSSIPSAR